jgi:hypothetical protein
LLQNLHPMGYKNKMEILDYINIKTKIKTIYYENIKKVFKQEVYKKGTILLKPDNASQKVIFKTLKPITWILFYSS